MLRVAIVLAATGLLAASLRAQEAEPVPPAPELIEKAELALKSHQLVKARRFLEKVPLAETDGVTTVRAVGLWIQVLVREGKPDEALAVLDRLQARTDLPAGVPEQIDRMREVVRAFLLARDYRVQAYRARLESLRMTREAEKAEARAHLLRDGTAPEEIERHLAEIDERYAPYVEAMTTELEEYEQGKPVPGRARFPGDPNRPGGPPRPGEIIDARRRVASLRARAERTLQEIVRRIDAEIAGYEEILASNVQPHGGTAVPRLRMIHEIERILREAVPERPAGAEKAIEALVGRIDELVADYEELRPWEGQPLGQSGLARLKMIHEVERILRQALVDRIAGIDPERLAAGRDAYREALEELRARGPRDSRGRGRVDEELEEIRGRLDGLEKSNAGIRALLEKLVEDR